MGPVYLQQFINGLTIGSVYALIALGYTMVYGVLEMINFAHGDVYMVGSFLGLLVLALHGPLRRASWAAVWPSSSPPPSWARWPAAPCWGSASSESPIARSAARAASDPSSRPWGSPCSSRTPPC